MLDTLTGKIITIVDMPLFMFVSGYFSSSVFSRPIKVVLKQKWQTIVRPTLLFTCLLMTMNYCKIPSSLSSIQFLKWAYFSFFTSYWFIWALLSSLFLTYLSLKLIRSKYPIIPLMISLVFILLIPRNLSVIPNLSSIQALFPFFIIGYLARKYELFHKIILKPTVYCLSCCLLFAIALYLYHGNQSFYYFASLPFTVWAKNYIIMLAGGIGAIVLLYLAVNYMQNGSKVQKTIAKVGEYSLVIYLLQQLFIFALAQLNIENSSRISQFIVSFLLFGVICVLVFLFSKNSKVAYYLMGKRLNEA